MDFDLNEEQRQVQELARRFADEEIAPKVEEWEREHYFPREAIEKMGELGFFGAAFAMGLGFGAVSNSMRAMAINLVPQERRGAANGTLYSVFDIGIASGSALLGAAAQIVESYAATYLFVAAIMLLAIALFFVLILPRYQRQVEREGQSTTETRSTQR